MLHTKYWVVEVRQVEFLDSQELTDSHLARTKVHLGDIWAPAARNPGYNMRNRYGREIYRHADHWTVVGHSNSWQGYNSGRWVKCKFPRHRACLDRYRADGNMHFPLPNHATPSKKKKHEIKGYIKEDLHQKQGNGKKERGEWTPRSFDDDEDRVTEKRKVKSRKPKKAKSRYG